MVSKVGRGRGGMGRESCRGRRLMVIERGSEGQKEGINVICLALALWVMFHLFCPLKDEAP